MKLTRRELVVAAAGSASAVKALAQSGAAAPAQALSQPTAADFAKQARDNIQQNRDTLAKFDIPMSIEPAFQFKA